MSKDTHPDKPQVDDLADQQIKDQQVQTKAYNSKGQILADLEVSQLSEVGVQKLTSIVQGLFTRLQQIKKELEKPFTRHRTRASDWPSDVIVRSRTN